MVTTRVSSPPLLDAAWNALVEGKPQTSAALCDAAGCTAPTLYHHFGSVPGLLEAAVQRGFGEFATAVEQGVRRTRKPSERIRRRGRAYLDWAFDNPVAYRVLFMTPRPDDEGNAPPHAGAGLDALISDVAQVLGPDADPLEPALVLWAQVHGLASLAICNPAVPRVFVESALDRGTTAILDGLTAQ